MPKPITSVEVWSGDELVARMDREDNRQNFVVAVGSIREVVPNPLLGMVVVMEKLEGAQ